MTEPPGEEGKHDDAPALSPALLSPMLSLGPVGDAPGALPEAAEGSTPETEPAAEGSTPPKAPAGVVLPPSPLLTSSGLTLSGAKQMLETLAEREERLTVLEFREGGSYVWRQLTRSQVLREANQDHPTLKARDIRLHVLSSFCKPNMWIREHCALINIYELKAILLPAKCFLFVPDGADSLLSHVMSRLATGVSDTSVPFVFRALEALLLTICSANRAAAQNLRPQVDSMLAAGVQLSSVARMSQLQLLKQSMIECHARTEGTRAALAAVLDDEQDLEAMEMLNRHELEMLLEAYMLEVSSVAEDMRTWQENVATMEATLAATQDTTRNQLLKANLAIAVMTLSLAVGNLVAAVFGMNLNSGAEDAEGAFGAVAGIVGGVSLLLPGLILLPLFWGKNLIH